MIRVWRRQWSVAQSRVLVARGNEELVFGAVAGTVVRAFADNADM